MCLVIGRKTGRTRTQVHADLAVVEARGEGFRGSSLEKGMAKCLSPAFLPPKDEF